MKVRCVNRNLAVQATCRAYKRFRVRVVKDGIRVRVRVKVRVRVRVRVKVKVRDRARVRVRVRG